MENRPLVTVVMNCYNGEKYLRMALDSVVEQTYTNWEIIFWDNQSKDKSAEIFKSYKDNRFKYFYAHEHTTLYKARNLAINRAKGDFISFLDVDDLWNKNKLEIQIPFFQNTNVGVVYSNSWLLKKNNKKKILINRKLPSGQIYNELIDDYPIGILTTVIRKKFYDKLKMKFDERFQHIGDFDIFVRLSKICLFSSLQEPLTYHRLHGKNLANLKKEEEVQESEIWLEENKFSLTNSQIKKIKKKINNRKFINYKIEKKYKECINMWLKLETNFFSLKNLILFLTPVILLKKILWYHQDSNDRK